MRTIARLIEQLVYWPLWILQRPIIWGMRLLVWVRRRRLDQQEKEIRDLRALVEEAERRQAQQQRTNTDPPPDAGDGNSGR